MSKFSLLNGVTVVILVTFGEMRLDFSVCNISKKYTWYIDTWTDSYKISQSGFFRHPCTTLLITKRCDIFYSRYCDFFTKLGRSQSVHKLKYLIIKPCQQKSSVNNRFYQKCVNCPLLPIFCYRGTEKY